MACNVQHKYCEIPEPAFPQVSTWGCCNPNNPWAFKIRQKSASQVKAINKILFFCKALWINELRLPIYISLFYSSAVLTEINQNTLIPVRNQCYIPYWISWASLYTKKCRLKTVSLCPECVCFYIECQFHVVSLVITAWCNICLKHLPILFNLTNGEKQENFIYNG